MGIGIKKLGVILGLTVASLSFSSAHEIGELLQKYKEASELYRKTRKESLGHLILFTREDIERMQARRLSDLLKALRFFTPATNRFGVFTLNNYGGSQPIPRHIRLYINDHEVSSLHTGSPFLVWENLPLDVVDHVEIYLGVGAIELGNDPATLIIKVYTKEPLKENASSLRAAGSSRKGYTGTFYSARELNSVFSYIFLITEDYDNRKDYIRGTQELSRDGRYRYAFFGLYSESMKIELGYGYTKKAPFMGFAMDNVADRGYTKAEDVYLTMTVYPTEDKSLKFVLSLDNHRRKHYESNSSGLYIPLFMDFFNPLNNPKDFYENAFFNKATVYVSKEFNTRENNLLTALSYKLYNSDIDARRYTTLGGTVRDVGETVPFNRQEIYSLILEDKLSINPGNLLIGGLKLDKYYRNGGFKDYEEFIARLGYISVLNENLSLKGFVSRSYIPPFFYDTDASGGDLDTMKIPFSFTLESVLSLEKLRVSVGGGYVRVEDIFAPDSTGRITNLDRSVEVKNAFIDLQGVLNENHKVQAGYSTYIEPEVKVSPTSGGYLRVLSSFGKLDAFAELVYRKSFTFRNVRIEDGYDLSSGLSYHATDSFTVSLKGENLLGKSIDIPYLVPQTGGVVLYPVRERTLYISVEWVF
ncbi:TonB-dependent receptor plug domain-containing protein [Hydrogenivirga sp.]